MIGVTQRLGTGAGIATATVILFDALMGRLMLRADENRVYILGHPLNWSCALKSHFSVPCPTCGLTRSIVLTLHGQVQSAWALAPGGPVYVLGLLGFGRALLILALLQALDSKAVGSAKVWVRNGTLVYGALATVIWLGGWAAHFAAALPTHR